jgi:hypothetical protein
MVDPLSGPGKRPSRSGAVVADAIVRAAAYPVRDLVVGGPER